MIKYLNIELQEIVVHFIGNKSYDEGVVLSDVKIAIDDDKLVNIFLKYFLTSFTGNEIHRLHNEVGLEQNEIFILVDRIFSNPKDLINQSKKIAQHLYSCSVHPKIVAGELYVSYFKDIIINEVSTDAIGIFKSETKEDYLKVNFEKSSHIVSNENGTSIKKLDKGCLIFNLDRDNGYQVCIIDNLNKSNEAVYWRDNFLNVQPIENDFHQTTQFLGIAKQFVTKQLDTEFEVSKADKIDLLNRSVEYFKTHSQFDKDEFQDVVFHDSGIVESFREFDQNYRRENKVEILNNFEISSPAVKKQARIFKSVLKLDKNFHIYIHGSKELIEQGIDEDGRKYYKIYYQNEE